jgi:membrane protein YqaA with SNARE-associated domain
MKKGNENNQPLRKSSYFNERGDLDWSVVIRKSLIFISFFVVAFLVIFAFMRPQMEYIARFVTETLRYPGLFLFTLVVDMFIVPLTVDIIFPFALHYNPVSFLAVVSIASALGGLGGYWIGRLLGHLPIIKTITSSFSQDGEQLIEKYGVWAIVIAGITPIPFSTVCWISGMLHVKFSKVALASLSRIPRMIIYYYALKGGLTLFF